MPEPAPVVASRTLTEGVLIEQSAAGARIVRNGVPLTPVFAAIESADVSAERGEVVFSARRATNFDIGLVSTDGSQVNWVPEDPADEVGPRWAPRGNKASFILRNAGGDFVRTVHIPTAVALIVAFPFSSITGIHWDMRGEEYSVTYETPDASPRVETMTYAGEQRRLSRPPATQLDVTVDPFARGALMLRPRTLRYDERLPLVVWLGSGRRNAWDADRARLIGASRLACIVTEQVDEALWSAVRETSWLDQGRVFVVDSRNDRPRVPAGVIRIAGDAAIPPGRYRRKGRSVETHPAGVESFAAGFIADQLKGALPLANR